MARSAWGFAGAAVCAGIIVVLAGRAARAEAVMADPPVAAQAAPAAAPAPAAPAVVAGDPLRWTKLETPAARGKQDDIFFVTPDLGWYVSGALGRIMHTADGGKTWNIQLEKPGTFFRCIGFVDEKTGFAGNIGVDYFPGVTDTTPLYKTVDGGATWEPVTTIEGPAITGLCAIEVVREPFINAGDLDHKVKLVAGGRVGGPACFLTSDDRGATWQQHSLPEQAQMVLDVHFFDRQHGVMASATNANVQESSALILTTDDGGKTWTERYRSPRPFEVTWKISFPTREVGYVTIQSYNPDQAASQRYVAKTTDGGATWTEIPLVDNHAVRQFGVAFSDANTGWVGAMPGGFYTADGGATWQPVKFGNAVNKIRLLPTEAGLVGYAVGVEVHKFDARK